MSDELGKVVDVEGRGMARAALVIGIAGSLLGCGGVGAGIYALYEFNKASRVAPVDGNIAAQLKEMRTDLEANRYGDCVNENILRSALGGPPVNLDECESERDGWVKEPPKYLSATAQPGE